MINFPKSLFNQLLLGMALCSFQFAIAQHTNFSDEYSYKRAIPLELLDQDEGGYYFLFGQGKYGYGNKSIVKYSADLKPTDKSLTLIKEGLLETKTIATLPSNENVTLVVREEFNDDKTYKILHIDPTNMQLIKEDTLATISVRDGLNSFEDFVFDSAGNSQLVFSQAQANKEKQKLSVMSFGSDHKEISQREYELAYNSKQLIYIQGGIYNGNFILLALKTKSNLQNYDLIHKNFDIILFEFNNGKVIEKVVIPAQDKYLIGTSYKKLDNGDLIIYGGYSYKYTLGVAGLFFYRINEDGELITSHNEDFSKDFLLKNLSDKKINKVEERIDDSNYAERFLAIQDIIEIEDDFIILAEKSWSTGSYTSRLYNSHDIAAIRINGKTGKIMWAEKVAKNNSHTNPIYTSYTSVLYDKSLYLIYNGSESNLDYKEGSPKPAFGKTSAMILTKLDTETGDYTRLLLYNKLEKGYHRLRPGLHFLTNENENVIFSQDYSNVRKQRFLLFDF